MTSVSPQALHQKIVAGESLYLLDVRTPREYAQVHVPGTILEPLEKFQVERIKRQTCGFPDVPLYVLCHSGSRAKQAIAILQRAGLSRCVYR